MTGAVRLAPTPSGFLHPGNAFSFLAAWLTGRARGLRVILRIEDVDVKRSRPSHIEAVLEDLRWLGLDWDEGPRGASDAESVFRQSSTDRRARYADVIAELTAQGHLFECICTRSTARTDAPQAAHAFGLAPSGSSCTGKCRRQNPSISLQKAALRLRLPFQADHFTDHWQGEVRIENLHDLGEPVLCRADGVHAYHLAVCVDDADQGVVLAVRGRDLLPWTHLHRYLHVLLGCKPPDWAHHGLLADPNGFRLAKRRGAGSLADLRAMGMQPEVLLGKLTPLLFRNSGHDGAPISLANLLALGEADPVRDATPMPNLG